MYDFNLYCILDFFRACLDSICFSLGHVTLYGLHGYLAVYSEY